MKLPHFLVVGAARSGTTSLHYYLRQHPGIFLPSLKEPSFFSFADEKQPYQKGKFAFVIREFEAYKELFAEADPDQVIGEISTPYLYLFEKSIQNIYKYHPKAGSLKIVILLRNPVDRAFSQYAWRLRDGREDLSFEEALSVEKERMKNNYSFDYFYFDRGLYFSQVRAYLDKFSEVNIVLLDDLKKDPQGMLKSICKFLGVEENFSFNRMEEQNAGYEPRWKGLSRLLTVESKLKFRVLNQLPDEWKRSMRQQFDRWNRKQNDKLKMHPDTKKKLIKLYKDDILKTQELIGRDLSEWIKMDKHD